MKPTAKPIHVWIRNEATGEEREFFLSWRHHKLLVLALDAYRRAPRFLADCFEFASTRGVRP